MAVSKVFWCHNKLYTPRYWFIFYYVYTRSCFCYYKMAFVDFYSLSRDRVNCDYVPVPFMWLSILFVIFFTLQIPLTQKKNKTCTCLCNLHFNSTKEEVIKHCSCRRLIEFFISGTIVTRLNSEPEKDNVRLFLWKLDPKIYYSVH